MKVTKRVLTLVSALFMATAFMACSDVSDDSPSSEMQKPQTQTHPDEQSTDTTKAQLASATPGQQIQIGGEKFYVIANHLSSGTTNNVSAIVGRSAVSSRAGIDTGDSNVDLLIEKFASDVYVRRSLEEAGITKYVQAMPANLDSAISISGTAQNDKTTTVKDIFYILNAESQTIATFEQRFMSDYLISNLVERKVSGYENLDISGDNKNTVTKEEFLKNFVLTDGKIDFNKIAILHKYYNPNRFDVWTTPENIGGSLSDKTAIRKTYKYDKNGEVATTKEYLKKVKTNKDYQKVTTIGGTEKIANSYVYSCEDNDDSKTYGYTLDGNGEYYSFKNTDSTAYGTERKFAVEACGTAPFGDSTGSNKNNNNDDYRNRVQLNFKNSYGGNYFSITVETTGKADGVSKSKKTLSSSWRQGDSTVFTNLPVTFNDGSETKNITLAEAVYELSNNIRFSEETTTLNGYTVPAKIYVRATYPDSFTNCAFLKDLDFFDITLVPDTSKTEGIFYKEIKRTGDDDEKNIPDFVNKYKEAFSKFLLRTYNTKSEVFTATPKKPEVHLEQEEEQDATSVDFRKVTLDDFVLGKNSTLSESSPNFYYIDGTATINGIKIFGHFSIYSDKDNNRNEVKIDPNFHRAGTPFPKEGEKINLSSVKEGIKIPNSKSTMLSFDWYQFSENFHGYFIVTDKDGTVLYSKEANNDNHSYLIKYTVPITGTAYILYYNLVDNTGERILYTVTINSITIGEPSEPDPIIDDNTNTENQDTEEDTTYPNPAVTTPTTAKTYSFAYGENGITLADFGNLADWNMDTKDVIGYPASFSRLKLSNGAILHSGKNKLRFHSKHEENAELTEEIISAITALNYNGGLSEGDLKNGVSITAFDRYIELPLDGAGTITATVDFRGANESDNPTGGPLQAAFIDKNGNLLGNVVSDELTKGTKNVTITGTVPASGPVYLVFSRNGAKKVNNNGELKGTGGLDVKTIKVTPAEQSE